MKTIKNLTRKDVIFSILPMEEEINIAHALSFKETGADHSEYIKKVQDDDGYNIWLWCTVKVSAKFGDIEGTAYLGGCAYENKADFIAGGYYEQMEAEAFEELLKTFNATIEPLVISPQTIFRSLWMRIRQRFAPIDIVIALPALIVLAYVITR